MFWNQIKVFYYTPDSFFSQDYVGILKIDSKNLSDGTQDVNSSAAALDLGGIRLLIRMF